MPIFADTSYFLALLQPDSDFFHSANRLAQTSSDSFLTTSAVLLELGSALSQGHDRSRFLDINDLVGSGLIQGIFVTPEIYELAIDLFTHPADKIWSLTDCISFIVMQQHNITDAASADHHFTQAGFRVLLKKRTP